MSRRSLLENTIAVLVLAFSMLALGYLLLLVEVA